jgi:hypothetical protein
MRTVKRTEFVMMIGLAFNLFVIIFICLQIGSHTMKRIVMMMKILPKASSKDLVETIIKVMMIENLDIINEDWFTKL